MGLYKITKPRVSMRRELVFYRTGSVIELTSEQAEDLEAELGLVPVKRETKVREFLKSMADKAKAKEQPEEQGAQTPSEVLQRDDYKEMLTYVSERSDEPLEARSREYLRDRLTEWADEPS